MSPKNILARHAKKVNDENADINPTPHAKIEEDSVIYPTPHVKVVMAEEYPVYYPAPSTEIHVYMDPTPHVEIVIDEEKTETDR